MDVQLQEAMAAGVAADGTTDSVRAALSRLQRSSYYGHKGPRPNSHGVCAIARDMLACIPQNIIDLVKSSNYGGGRVTKADNEDLVHVLDLHTNALWIKGVIKAFPRSVPSAYMIADALLVVDEVLCHNLYRDRDQHRLLALQDGALLKRLVGHLRTLWRAQQYRIDPDDDSLAQACSTIPYRPGRPHHVTNSTTSRVAELKALLRENNKRTLEGEGEDDLRDLEDAVMEELSPLKETDSACPSASSACQSASSACPSAEASIPVCELGVDEDVALEIEELGVLDMGEDMVDRQSRKKAFPSPPPCWVSDALRPSAFFLALPDKQIIAALSGDVPDQKKCTASATYVKITSSKTNRNQATSKELRQIKGLLPVPPDMPAAAQSEGARRGTRNYTVKSANGAAIRVQLANKVFRVISTAPGYELEGSPNNVWSRGGINAAWLVAVGRSGFANRSLLELAEDIGTV